MAFDATDERICQFLQQYRMALFEHLGEIFRLHAQGTAEQRKPGRLFREPSRQDLYKQNITPGLSGLITLLIKNGAKIDARIPVNAPHDLSELVQDRPATYQDYLPIVLDAVGAYLATGIISKLVELKQNDLAERLQSTLLGLADGICQELAIERPPLVVLYVPGSSQGLVPK